MLKSEPIKNPWRGGPGLPQEVTAEKGQENAISQRLRQCKVQTQVTRSQKCLSLAKRTEYQNLPTDLQRVTKRKSRSARKFTQVAKAVHFTHFIGQCVSITTAEGTDRVSTSLGGQTLRANLSSTNES